jgi:hypothetical protein
MRAPSMLSKQIVEVVDRWVRYLEANALPGVVMRVV